MTLTFSGTTIAAYAVSGAVMLIGGLAYMIGWKKRTGTKWFPIITGAVTFLLFALVLKSIPLYPILTAENDVSDTINNEIWLKAAVAGLSAGIFEETGRFLAFKTVLKKDPEKHTALDYGVGHGGIELLYAAVLTIGYVAICIAVNQSGLETFLADIPEMMQPDAIAKLEDVAGHGFEILPLGLIERASALMAHMGFSIMVFRAVRDKKSRWMYPAAIALHTAADMGAVLLAEHVLLLETVLFVFAAVILCVAVCKVYRRMPSVQEVRT